MKAMIPKTALALLIQAGADPVGSVASLCLAATVSNIRGEVARRDDAVEAVCALAEGLGRCGNSALGVRPLLLGRTTRLALID